MRRRENSPDFMTPTDQALIQKAQRGDIVAFEELVHRYDNQVLSIAATYVESAEDAKDIYQEVFMRVYRGLPKFQWRSEFSTWLFRITTNVCLTHRSRRRKRAHVSLDGDIEKDDPQPNSSSDLLMDTTTADQQTLNSEIAAHIEEAMNSLSPQQRLVFTLRHYQGYKLKEIAAMMSCAEGTVKKYLFNATQKMRQQLKDLL